MIRWYDYAVAVLAAYFISDSIILSLTASTWFEPLFFAGAAYLFYDLWMDYCNIRKNIEHGK
jgi:hypothetical protein